MNQATGGTGLLPARPMFGNMQKFPTIKLNLSTQKTSMEAIKMLQAKMSSIIFERQVQNEFSHKISLAADRVDKAGEVALV